MTVHSPIAAAPAAASPVPGLRIQVKLCDLGLAPENLRFEVPEDAEVPRLADTIRAAGVIYPPIVRKGRRGEAAYEYFESGKARLNVDRVHQVAKILNADPYAILAAIDIGSPAFALRTIENKMGTLWLMALLEFDATAQDNIARLAPAVLIAGFTKMFDELLFLAVESDASTQDWMSDKPLQAPKGEPEDEDRADDEAPEPPHGNPDPKPPRDSDPDAEP